MTRYGSREDAQLTIDGHGLEWFISQQSDRFDNGIDYRYRIHQGQHYLDEIQYADVSLDFNYVNRPDVLSSCLLYTSPSPRDGLLSRMPSSA